MASAAEWLATWAPRPARQVFILVACVRYSTETRWLGPSAEAERARVADVVSRFAANAPRDELHPEVYELPELPSITREHMDLWLDHAVVRQFIGPALRKTIDDLFEQREYWSMDDLRDRLTINYPAEFIRETK